MLTKRLQKIIDVLPQCKMLADVGCDHGYIGLEALARNIVEKVVFVDISAPSLEKARKHCAEEFRSRAAFVCQDGLQNICCDCAVIAGMGGLEIISVLNGAENLPRFLVLQPMRSQSQVREFLQKSYNIVSDEKFHDGKFYDLIFAEKSSAPVLLSSDEIEFGKTNLVHPSEDFLQFLHIRQKKCRQILTDCDDDEISEKLAATERILQKFAADLQ